MCLNHAKYSQQGFGMPVVVFVLVIMALLAVAITQLASRSNLASAQAGLATRALYAAESGAQWAASRLLVNSSEPQTQSLSDAACSAIDGETLSFTEAGLASCQASVSCNTQALTQGSLYQLRIEGRCGSGQVSGLRVIEVGVKNDL